MNVSIFSTETFWVEPNRHCNSPPSWGSGPPEPTLLDTLSYRILSPTLFSFSHLLPSPLTLRCALISVTDFTQRRALIKFSVMPLHRFPSLRPLCSTSAVAVFSVLRPEGKIASEWKGSSVRMRVHVFKVLWQLIPLTVIYPIEPCNCLLFINSSSSFSWFSNVWRIVLVVGHLFI